MSVHDEREIRHQLSGLLDGVEPRPAPVATAVSCGRRIRTRRKLVVVAGLAAVVTLAAVLPQVLPGQSAGPLAPRHYSVTVGWPGPVARGGVIAAGVTDGKRWRVVVSGPASAPMIVAEGAIGTIGTVQGPVVTGDPVSMESETTSPGPNSFSVLYGTVSTTVTSVAIRLPDGESVNLTPVPWGGNRWIGLVLPAGVPITRAVAYAGTRELAYAVPFNQVELDVWWPPGDAGPARVTRTIGSGVVAGQRWQATARIGPWGYCYVFGGTTACLDSTSGPHPTRQPVSVVTCSPGNSRAPTLGIAAAAPSIQRVVLQFSTGRSASFPVVQVAGSRVFGFAIPAHVRATGSREYGPAGQVVGSTTGSMWNC